MIIDEADMMLEMGFINDIEFIVESIKNKHQTALFSATFPKEIISLSKKYQKNSIKVLIDQDNKISEEQLRQYYYFTQKYYDSIIFKFDYQDQCYERKKKYYWLPN